MSQQQNTVNLFIEDVNGQQVIKLATSALPSKSISMINAGVYRTATQDSSGGSGTPTGGQILRTINIAGKAGSHIMAVPASSPVKVVEYKGDGSGQMPKTIQLVPAQMQMLGAQRLANRTTNQGTQSAPIIVPAQTVSNSMPVQSALNSKNYISPILDHSGSRKRHDMDTEQDYLPEYSNIKRRKTEKMGKGLRHFSMKVCEKVRKKGTTSYNEVADELVAEFTNPLNSSPSDQFDQKNIRRRVYDALNVLMAMNIISKEKKEIRWLGLPTNSAQECTSLERHKESLGERIREKTHQLHELILQQISFKSLVERNRGLENKYGPPASNTAIQLPFIIVNTSKQTVIECRISNDKMEYLFSFDDKFEIHDDIEVLKRMGMVLGLDQGKCSPEQLQKAKSMVPANLESYVVQLAQGKTEPELEDLLAGPSSNQDETEVPLVTGNVGGGGTGGVGLSRHSSHTSLSDPLSPSVDNFGEFSDEESEMSSDVEVH